MLNWDALEDQLAEAFPDRAVSRAEPHIRHAVDQALATWKDRITDLGLDITDETQLFAFVAGLCEFERYLSEVWVPAHFTRDWQWGQIRELRQMLGNVLGTIRPYIEAHVPPGSIGSGYEG